MVSSMTLSESVSAIGTSSQFCIKTLLLSARTSFYVDHLQPLRLQSGRSGTAVGGWPAFRENLLRPELHSNRRFPAAMWSALYIPSRVTSVETLLEAMACPSSYWSTDPLTHLHRLPYPTHCRVVHFIPLRVSFPVFSTQLSTTDTKVLLASEELGVLKTATLFYLANVLPRNLIPALNHRWLLAIQVLDGRVGKEINKEKGHVGEIYFLYIK